MPFVAELRRRNVHKIAAAYALVSWILIEAGSVLLPTFGAPEWFFKGYVILIIAGFLLALMLAWLLELTPEGVKLDKDIDRRTPVRKDSPSKMTYSIIGLLIVALTISITLNVTGMRSAAQPVETEVRGSSIAVLPFENRSTDPENALFADGIHDDLLTTLANIQALKVISRTSVLKYRNPTRNLPEIASELGVSTVLEGSVQRAGNNVRINVQLIDAKTDEHIWAKIYDRELTAINIFQIQSEISAEIAHALKRQLTPEELGRMAAVPTENLQAYSLYLAGRGNISKRTLTTLQEARRQFQDAINLDPNYSLAYSGLADSILLLTINHKAIPHEEAWELAKNALDKALTLDDQNADAYASLGLLRMTRMGHNKSEMEMSGAETAFRRAIELSPNHAQAYSWYASLKTEQGDFDAAIELYKKSLELDPLARIPRSNLAGLYAQQGRNDEALAQWLESVRINPEWPTVYDNIANQLARLGRLDEAYAWAVRAAELSTDPLIGQTRIAVLWQFGEVKQASELIESLPPDNPLAPITGGFASLMRGDYQAAIDSWESAIAGGFKIPEQYLANSLADTSLLIGDFARASQYVLQNKPELEDPQTEITNHNARGALRYAFLLLQDEPGSVRAAQLLDDVLQVTENSTRLGVGGHGIRDVQALALQGKHDAAITRLREAFDEGFRGLRLYDNWSLVEDPFLSPIRDDDEFRVIASDIGAAIDVMQRRVEAARSNGNIEPILASTRRSLTQ